MPPLPLPDGHQQAMETDEEATVTVPGPGSDHNVTVGLPPARGAPIGLTQANAMVTTAETEMGEAVKAEAMEGEFIFFSSHFLK